jgi:hypothetical protein
VAICRISDQNGDRYTDWILHPLNYQITDLISFPNYCLLPYNLKKTRHLQYVSGAFFISTREFMKKFPFDETLVWVWEKMLSGVLDGENKIQNTCFWMDLS